MVQRQLNKKGFVTLFSLIILMVIAVSVFTSVLLTNMDSLKSVEALREGLKAKTNSYSCMEIALDKLKNDNTYTGNETIILGDGECEILSISGSGNNNWVVRSIGKSKDYFKKLEVSIIEINPVMQIEYFRENDF